MGGVREDPDVEHGSLALVSLDIGNDVVAAVAPDLGFPYGDRRDSSSANSDVAVTRHPDRRDRSADRVVELHDV